MRLARYYQESGNTGISGGIVMMIFGIGLTPLLGFGLGIIVIGLLMTIDGIREQRKGFEMSEGVYLARSTTPPTMPGGDGLYPTQHRHASPSEAPEDYEPSWVARNVGKLFKWWMILWIPLLIVAVAVF